MRDEKLRRNGRGLFEIEKEAKETKNSLFIEIVDEQQNDGVDDQFYRSIV